ncbi:hypothetical protein XENTR_v10016677 [Xenopus tropicalis]|nr:hypothetical protein XENTR_v10016677 [Xenopus tropicalis]
MLFHLQIIPSLLLCVLVNLTHRLEVVLSHNICLFFSTQIIFQFLFFLPYSFIKCFKYELVSFLTHHPTYCKLISPMDINR